MPFTLVHGLVSYFVVCFFTKDKKLRALGFAAGMLPDLDGVPVLFDLELFYRVHHELFHPPIYGILLAVPAAMILGRFFEVNPLKSFAVFAFSFALHPVTDVLFTDWPVRLLWPFSQEEFIYPVFVQYNFVLAFAVLAGLLAQIILYAGKKGSSG